MSRYRGPRVKIVRRLGELPGFTQKQSKKTNRPGQHGAKENKISPYGLRLQEKQKLRYNYGVTERQLLNYVRKARRKKGSTGDIILQLLEMRLDNIVFRLGFAPTILSARQLVTHGHIRVNGQVVNIPSYECRINDKVQALLSLSTNANLPTHLSRKSDENIGQINSFADRSSIALNINELLVVEYYSRKA